MYILEILKVDGHLSTQKFLDFFLLLINNPHYQFSSENIRNCLRMLHRYTSINKLIVKLLKKRKIIENYSIKEKTDLLLMLSEYAKYPHLYKNYKLYISIFSQDDKFECQKYLINNFEEYFQNYYSSIPPNTNIRYKAQEMIKDILIDRNIKKFEIVKKPHLSCNVLGEDIKYRDMQLVLCLFNEKQKKIKYRKGCLFKNINGFFKFFAQHIKTHKKCESNEQNVKYLKILQKKYNLASISWNNRIFYKNQSLEKLDDVFQNALKFFNLKDLSSIHFQLRDTCIYNYSASYLNFHCSDFNAHIIQQIGVHELQSNFIHEVSHFIHLNQRKKFQHRSFKRLKDTLYLHKEKKLALDKVSQLLSSEYDLLFIEDIKKIFTNYLYTSYSEFNKQLMKKKLDNNIKSALDSIYFDYKKYKIVDSSQYLKWKKCSYEFKTNPLYFNKNHEIHARLNEILSGNIPYNHMILDQYYLPHFPLIKDDLIEFNQYLLKNFKNI